MIELIILCHRSDEDVAMPLIGMLSSHCSSCHTLKLPLSEGPEEWIAAYLLEKCKLAVVLLSERVQSKKWLPDELAVALGSLKNCVVVALDDAATNNWIWPLVSTAHIFEAPRVFTKLEVANAIYYFTLPRITKFGGGTPMAPDTSHVSLTARERQVVEEMIRGRTNVEMARALNLSEKTIKHHIVAIMKKLSSGRISEGRQGRSGLTGGQSRVRDTT